MEFFAEVKQLSNLNTFWY